MKRPSPDVRNQKVPPSTGRRRQSRTRAPRCDVKALLVAGRDGDRGGRVGAAQAASLRVDTRKRDSDSLPGGASDGSGPAGGRAGPYPAGRSQAGGQGRLGVGVSERSPKETGTPARFMHIHHLPRTPTVSHSRSPQARQGPAGRRLRPARPAGRAACGHAQRAAAGSSAAGCDDAAHRAPQLASP